ncbi:adipose-secreted signaling protein isoform X4 [Pelodiscus sinensis]|uniref:adipose-secreted signaling protein isoform X4 n=1 Tax=Pelodiscus sinensis TaxID=13735 RepID=UPI003F6C5F11
MKGSGKESSQREQRTLLPEDDVGSSRTEDTSPGEGTPAIRKRSGRRGWRPARSCEVSPRGGQMAAANQGTKPKAGGVRFAASQTVEGAHSHVHFDEKLHDSVVMVTQEKDGDFLVKVGFLKILHKYEITFLLPPVQRLGKDVCAVPLPNLNLKVLSVTPVSEGYSVKCEYTAHKEGVLREEMQLSSETHDGACVKVVVQARVMDRHHGTPMLLEGVRCIGAELEYDSEQSEWQGFD